MIRPIRPIGRIDRAPKLTRRDSRVKNPGDSPLTPEGRRRILLTRK
jgi:hypothetical protein